MHLSHQLRQPVEHHTPRIPLPSFCSLHQQVRTQRLHYRSHPGAHPLYGSPAGTLRGGAHAVIARGAPLLLSLSILHYERSSFLRCRSHLCCGMCQLQSIAQTAPGVGVCFPLNHNAGVPLQPPVVPQVSPAVFPEAGHPELPTEHGVLGFQQPVHLQNQSVVVGHSSHLAKAYQIPARFAGPPLLAVAVQRQLFEHATSESQMQATWPDCRAPATHPLLQVPCGQVTTIDPTS